MDVLDDIPEADREQDTLVSEYTKRESRHL